MKAYLQNLYSKNPKFSVVTLFFVIFLGAVLTVFTWPIYSQPLEITDLNYSSEASDNDSEIVFDASVEEGRIDNGFFSSPAVIELSLESDVNFTTSSGPLPPFGGVTASSEENELILWNSDYQEAGIRREEYGLRTTFQQVHREWNRTATREYLIRPDRIDFNFDGFSGSERIFRKNYVEPGKYEYNSSLEILDSEAPWMEGEQLNYSMEFELTRK